MTKTLSLIALFALLITSVPVSAATKLTSEVPDAPSAEELKAKYQSALTSGEKVRILVVPGHEPGLGGTEYQGFYEREMVLEIAEKLAATLKANPRFEVFTTRTALEGWTSAFAEYFDEEARDIEKFVKNQKKIFERKVRDGDVEERTEEVPHAAARSDIAMRLYGVNRWANKNGIDLIVSLHINDTGGGEALRLSTSGFAIYVPDREYGNSAASMPIAEAIAKRLSFISSTSTLPIENKGIVEDQSLIAIGAYDTLAAPSLLIEYGYITEEKFLHTETRRAVSTDFSFETYRGLLDFFGDATFATRKPLILPYAWKEGKPGEGATVDTYALQIALRTLGLFPPAGKTLTECQLTGIWSPCTEEALKAFQASKGFEQTGAIGPKTKAALTASGV